jgi:hypothetical protein
MTPLPRTVRKDDFDLVQVLRNNKVAIYRQHRPDSDAIYDAYEVILPQVRNTNYKGEPVEAYEGYPSAESWGEKGWTFTNFDDAFEKLLKVTRKASRTRTVSRRNRRSGQAGIRSRVPANAPQRVRLAGISTSPVRHSRQHSSFSPTI